MKLVVQDVRLMILIQRWVSRRRRKVGSWPSTLRRGGVGWRGRDHLFHDGGWVVSIWFASKG